MNAGQYFQWHDLFVVIDDGSIPLPRYAPIEAAMRDQVRQFPQGIALIGILPISAKPPPEDVKQFVKALFTRMASSITCLAYAVEGTGFKGVAARATLVGMKIFASRPYPIYVETSVPEVLKKVLPHLHGGRAVTTDVNVIAKLISDWRMGRVPPPALHGSETATVK